MNLIKMILSMNVNLSLNDSFLCSIQKQYLLILQSINTLHNTKCHIMVLGIQENSTSCKVFFGAGTNDHNTYLISNEDVANYLTSTFRELISYVPYAQMIIHQQLKTSFIRVINQLYKTVMAKRLV